MRVQVGMIIKIYKNSIIFIKLIFIIFINDIISSKDTSLLYYVFIIRILIQAFFDQFPDFKNHIYSEDIH